MFTGIIEVVGTIEAIHRRDAMSQLIVRAPGLGAEVEIGDSVAVNGACLTVTAVERDRLSFDAVPETLTRTALLELREGSQVNLERAMCASARLDGHIVQGHVDGIGTVERLEQRGEDVRLFVRCDSEFSCLLVEKGSVAIDGVSLTVVGVRETGFDVALIPHTLTVTTLGAFQPAQRVNLEADVLGKYVKRYVDRLIGSPQLRNS